jgi:hypothetical protein
LDQNLAVPSENPPSHARSGEVVQQQTAKVREQESDGDKKGSEEFQYIAHAVSATAAHLLLAQAATTSLTSAAPQ